MYVYIGFMRMYIRGCLASVNFCFGNLTCCSGGVEVVFDVENLNSALSYTILYKGPDAAQNLVG